MTAKRFRRGRLPSAFFLLGSALLIASCQSSAKQAAASDETDVSETQPRSASYSCADGGLVTIENLGTSVRVLGPDGESTELPASPSNQRSRYGLASDAIVIEGREALFMKGGQEPLTCTR